MRVTKATLKQYEATKDSKKKDYKTRKNKTIKMFSIIGRVYEPQGGAAKTHSEALGCLVYTGLLVIPPWGY